MVASLPEPSKYVPPNPRDRFMIVAVGLFRPQPTPGVPVFSSTSLARSAN